MLCAGSFVGGCALSFESGQVCVCGFVLLCDVKCCVCVVFGFWILCVLFCSWLIFVLCVWFVSLCVDV